MKRLYFILFFIFAATTAFSQNPSNNSYGMTTEENKMWLKRLSDANKDQQFTLIQNRFFRHTEFKKPETEDVPVIVANGVVLNEIRNAELKNLLANQLAPNNVQITILENEPEGLYVNKRWTGVILLVINDKKFKKLLKK